jgi:RNA 3'-terminal phosphate cyclase (ATP)
VITIDGSQGEGGGQILRTTLSLSALTATPVRLRNVRASRNPPGLSPQHLMAVRALADLTQAEVTGDALRSTTITFAPTQPPQSGAYSFDVADAAANGSAGSVTLLLQALLLPLAFTDGVSTITLKGGTHVRWSPSAHFLKHVYLPTLFDSGVRVSLELQRYGFYPAGGGILQAQIAPARPPLTPMTLTERGALQRIHGEAVSCNLPAHIAKRMAQQAETNLERMSAATSITPTVVDSDGPGAGLFLAAEYEHAHAGFMAMGEPGKPSEQVADEACNALLKFHASGASVDRHLADQLLLPMALADGRSVIRTSAITTHLRTNAQNIQQLLPTNIEFAPNPDGLSYVEVEGIGWGGDAEA